ncbi:uncharacterized protein LOC110691068 [Chenopodium quinoa]|uniref:uncharacterized protein LOC110691068 n=1 Tax=Chenopodium quinoa TaxID=63459 RepID=UPI000B77444F|nr:uncharacterized protein LOC110691068 [Chenopodium quinoa]
MAEQKIHPATLVTNIKTSSLLFLITVAKAPESSSSDPALWQRLDNIVRQWIYNTISTDLLDSIIDPDDKAIDAWKRLQNFFLNNKSARALHLDAQFTNTRLDQFEGVKPYCTRLKSLADSLRNVGDAVSDNRMALQLLKGLSEDYKDFRTSVRHLNPLPNFDALRSMLELEEQGNATDVLHSSEEAHLSQSSSAAFNSQQGKAIYESPRNSQPARGGRKPKGKGGKKSGAGSGGRSNQPPQHTPKQSQSAPHHSSSQQRWQYPHPWAYWPAPPCPYPSQALGPMQWAARPSQSSQPQPGLLGSRPQQQAYYMSDPPSHSSGYVPTNIEQAMHTMSLADPNYYMDIELHLI